MSEAVPQLVQIMACRHAGAKPLSEPVLEYCWPLAKTFHWNLNRNLYILIQENAFENVVCEIMAIVLQCVNTN